MLPDQKFSDMKKKIARCLSKNADAKLTVDSIRLWKSNFNYNTREKIQEYFQKHNVTAD